MAALKEPHQHAAAKQQHKRAQNRKRNLAGKNRGKNGGRTAWACRHHHLNAAIKNRLGEIRHPFTLGGDRNIRNRAVCFTISDRVKHLGKAIFAHIIDGEAQLIGDGPQQIDTEPCRLPIDFHRKRCTCHCGNIEGFRRLPRRCARQER